jgi:hypothetical protein
LYKFLEKTTDFYNKKRYSFPMLIDQFRQERKMTPSELYKKAMIDRRLYSKIMGPKRSGENNYHPRRKTVFVFMFALELSLEDATRLLASANMIWDMRQEFDRAIISCLKNRTYDLDRVNEVLDDAHLPLLGNLVKEHNQN